MNFTPIETIFIIVMINYSIFIHKILNLKYSKNISIYSPASTCVRYLH